MPPQNRRLSYLAILGCLQLSSSLTEFCGEEAVPSQLNITRDIRVNAVLVGGTAVSELRFELSGCVLRVLTVGTGDRSGSRGGDA
jgi:hypothetical protein